MSVENLTTLTSSALTDLKSLASTVTFDSKNRRVGANGIDNMSVYLKSRWYDWTSDQTTTFKDALGSTHVEKSVVGWFLQLPANTGFLDTMDYWNDNGIAGKVVAYSLTNSNNITVDGTTYTVNEGEGIKFSLNLIHEIATSPNKREWACLMLMEN